MSMLGNIRRMQADLEAIKNSLSVNDMISEKEAAELLKINIRTLQNYRTGGKIEGCYSKGVAGAIFYFKSKLMGLNKSNIH